jgi:hypothetical protein
MRLHLPTARKSSLHSLHRVILEFLCSLCANSCHHRPCADAIFVGDLQQAKGLTELDDILKLVVTSHALERLVDFSQEGMMAAEMDVQAFVFASATCSLWRNADKLLLPDRYGKRGTTGADLRVKKKASADLCLCV